MNRLLAILPLLGSVAAPCGAAESKPHDLKSKVEPILEEYCWDCHDDAIAKADLDLYSLDYDPEDASNRKLWEHVFDRVHGHEMPPKKKDQPSDEERAALLSYLKTDLIAADRAEIETLGRVRGRRLTRTEYEHTLHDLLGIRIPLANKLPADDSTQMFDSVAKTQQFSHFHLDRYLNAADLALEEAFSRILEGDRVYSRRLGPQAIRTRNDRGPDVRNGLVIAWNVRGKFRGRIRATRVAEDGWYRITLKNLHGLNPGPDGVVWGSLETGQCDSSSPLLYYGDSIEATAEKRDYVADVWMKDGHRILVRPNEAGTKSIRDMGGNQNFNPKRKYGQEGYPGIAFNGIKIERIYPGGDQSKVRELLLPGITFEGDQPVDPEDPMEVQRLVAEFAERAFRRPVTQSQLEPYQKLADDYLDETGDWIGAIRTAYRAILCSPRFLTFVEKPGRLDDHAIASRLSYMLWSSLPDATLTDLAGRGELNKPEVLAEQVERMLDDSRAERFVDHFTDQWLNLKEIDFTTPDPRRYGRFDLVVQDSMLKETRMFIRELIEEDLSVRNFVRSDFAFLNGRLKTHYQLKNVPLVAGEGLQKVAMGPKQRSGLVTQGSILKVTADGSTTSPVLRGVWIGERILGLHIPPPPPNVGAVEPDIRGAVSIRDQLAKHSTESSCASCHIKIDPPGFALESYDPIGQWRQFYGNSAKSAKVDPSGETPEGRKFTDINGWKEIYHDKPGMLARAFANQLLTYATGAPIRFSDREAIDAIVSKSAKNDYGLRSIIQATIRSKPFLHK